MDKDIFVQNVKHYCDLRGIKPTVACKESGAGKDLINQIETRGSIPSVEKVQLLASYLGVTTSELLGEDKNYTCVFMTHEFPFQDSLDDLYASLENVGFYLSSGLREHLATAAQTQEIATPLSVWVYAQVRSLEPVEVKESADGMTPPHTPHDFIDDSERKMLHFYRLADKRGREMLIKYLCAAVEPSDSDEFTIDELCLLSAYRAADERARQMVDLALEPWKKKDKFGKAM